MILAVPEIIAASDERGTNMRLMDAFKTLQPGKKKERTAKQLYTVWGEELAYDESTIPLPEYPRPQLVREQWRNLNGWWDYAIVRKGSLCPEPEGKIRVPFSPETALSGVNRILKPGEEIWYRRSIEDLEIPEGGRIILHFGAVDERCTVWWNGRKAANHRNGYLPFSVDVTEYARPGFNTIQVRARDDTDTGTACRGKQRLQPGGMFYHAQSGIWQTVWLEMVPEHYVTELKISPDLPGETVEIALTMNEAEEVEIELEGHTCHFGKEAFSGGQNKTLKARLAVENPRLWSPEKPELYTFTVTAGRDIVKSYFAMRSFGKGQDEHGYPCLTLNGRPYFFHGVLDQGYWPESLMTPPSYEAFEWDIMEMKRLGFNMIRKHEKIEAARWYTCCDRAGMIVWQDMVHGGERINAVLMTYLPTLFPWLGNHLKDRWYGLFGRKNMDGRKCFERDLAGMIHALYSVPCIAVWGLFNEGWGQFDALRLSKRIRREDPGRLIDHASGWFDQGGDDMKSVHNYFRPLSVKREKRPFVLSEYGGYACRIREHDMYEEQYGYRDYSPEDFPGAYHLLMKKVFALKEEGLAADVYTQLSDIEEEINGLVSYDRRICKIKDAEG